MKGNIIYKLFLVVGMSFLLYSCGENIVNLDLDDEDVKDVSQDVVSPYYVDINWDETEIIENDTVSGKVILSLNSYTEKIIEGSVISIIDPLKPGIKVVTKAVSNGENIMLETVKGDLTNIFANVEISLEYSPETVSRGGSQITAYPKAVGEEDKEGRYKWKTVIQTLNPKIIKIFDLDGYEMPIDEEGISVKFPELNSQINMNYRISFNFGLRKKHVVEDVKGVVMMYKSQQIKAIFHSSFNLESNLVVEGECKSEYHEEIEDFVPVLKNGPLKTIKFHILFDVAGVPVPVAVNIKPLTGALYDFKGSAGVKGVARLNNYFELDALWDMGKEDPYKIMSQFTGPVLDVTGSNFHCSGKADMKMWFYPSMSFYVYDVLGPVVDIKPYIRVLTNIGSHRTGYDYSKDYVGYKYDAMFGMDVRADISSRIMGLGKENGRWFGTKFTNLFEKNLVSLPTKIDFASATPNKVEAGRTMVLNFNVKGSVLDMIDEQADFISLPVKFVGNGTIDKVISYTEGGTAHVIWTPSTDDDRLTAILYDGEGKVIDSETYNGEKKDEYKHLVQIGDMASMKYDVLGRIESYVDSEESVKFHYNNDGLYAITLMDGVEPVILSDFVFTQEGYLKSFTNKEDDLVGTCSIDYNDDLQPISMKMRDNDGFSASINWDWELGKIKEMRYSNNEGLSERIVYQYDSPFIRANPLRHWSWFTSCGTMSFLTFSKLMGYGSEIIPSGLIYITNDSGQKESISLKLACSFDGYDIKKEVASIGNLNPIEVEYIYSSPFDITDANGFNIRHQGMEEYPQKSFFSIISKKKLGHRFTERVSLIKRQPRRLSPAGS